MSNEYPISPYKDFCDGYGGDRNKLKRYILGVTLGIGISGGNLSHPGSNILDETNAFDLAEIDGPYIGQLNMSVVSSFCGSQGLIWGYDIANNFRKKKEFEELGLKEVEYKEKKISVYNGDFLLESLSLLFGTVSERKFNIIPGAHVPFASKNIKVHGDGIIYSSIAIGIPIDRKKNACLLMEDIGLMRDNFNEKEKLEIISNLSKSIIEVGLNQHVEYKECLVLFKSKKVEKGQVGCALVAAPYFTLAQSAIPQNIWGSLDFERLYKMNLKEWSDYISKR